MKTRLFGSSGVRGIVNRDLIPNLASKIGLAVASSSKTKKVFVARDTRVSGQMLENALISGLISGGATVDCLGVIPTPVLAYLTKKLDGDAGIMITASHNPAQYNGIKIFDSEGMAYNEKKQEEIERIIEQERFRFADWRNFGKANFTYRADSYQQMITKSLTLGKEWRLVVDSGCGATCSLAPSIFDRLGCRVAAINMQPDGLFPARDPEPNAESLKPLASIVKKTGADVGIAYDGDGDRVAFIDDRGCFVDFDRVLTAYAAYLAKKNRGGIVVTNVESSMSLERTVRKHGGKVVRTKVGDVYVAKAVKRHRALFGGEPCGAWIHPQFHYCPDGILSSILLLRALEDEDEKLSTFISKISLYPTLRQNISVDDKVKHKIVNRSGETLKLTFPRYKEYSTVDGVRLALDDGWILVRASGTEPLIRVTVEAESLKVSKEIMEKMVALVIKMASMVKK